MQIWSHSLKKDLMENFIFNAVHRQNSLMLNNLVWFKILYICDCFGDTIGNMQIKHDDVDGNLVVPFWPNQVCYPILLKMLTSVSILLHTRRSVLHLPQSPT